MRSVTSSNHQPREASSIEARWLRCGERRAIGDTCSSNCHNDCSAEKPCNSHWNVLRGKKTKFLSKRIRFWGKRINNYLEVDVASRTGCCCLSVGGSKICSRSSFDNSNSANWSKSDMISAVLMNFVLSWNRFYSSVIFVSFFFFFSFSVFNGF